MPDPRDAAIRMAVALVVLTGVSTVLGLLLVHGMDGSVGELDRDVAEALARHRTPSLDAATAVVTLFAETYTVAALWVAAMAVARWRTGRWWGSLLLFVAVGGETLTFLFTSVAVDRPPSNE